VPLLSNQSIQALVPSFIYPIVLLAFVCLVVLWIGSLGALIKKPRVKKTRAMMSLVILLVSLGMVGATTWREAMQYNNNQITKEESTITTMRTDEELVTLQINGNGAERALYFSDFFGDDFGTVGLFQQIEILPTDSDEISVAVTDTFNSVHQPAAEISGKRTMVTAVASGNTVMIDLPTTIFAQKVPFVFAERVLTISVPKDKRIAFSNSSALEWDTPSSWSLPGTGGTSTRISCIDKNTFAYDASVNARRCSNTTSQIADEDDDDYDDDDLREDRREDQRDEWREDQIQDNAEQPREVIYIGLPVSEAEMLAAEQ
jgi:hypothetical protein